MNTNLPNASDTTHATPVPATAHCGLALVLDLLAAAGLDAEAVYDGDAQQCPHCLSQVLSEAA